MKNFDFILTRFGALVCALKGHRRGKRVGAATDIINNAITFYCARCGARWTRKQRKAGAGK